MESSPAIMGLMIGLLIGLLDFIALRFIRQRLMARAPGHGASNEEKQTVSAFLDIAAYGSLILFPLIGYFAGPYVFPAGLNGGGG